MFKKIVPLQKEQHANLKLQKITSFSFAAGVHLTGIMAAEFSRAATNYPIVFIEDPKTYEFMPVALLGLQQGENLFVDQDGKWEANYIPAIIRRYPFVLARTDEENRFSVCIDEECPFLSVEGEGSALFQENGEPSEVTERVKQYLRELHQMEVVTKLLCKTLKEKYMLAPLNMQVREADTVKNISGAFVIHEQRLNNLSDSDFLELRHQNFLPTIFNHLTSLGQIERLAQMRSKRFQ